MNICQEYVQTLPDDVKKVIIKNFNELEQKGIIGECQLRTHGEQYAKRVGIQGMHILFCMNQVAFECYRYFAEKYLQKEG